MNTFIYIRARKAVHNPAGRCLRALHNGLGTVRMALLSVMALAWTACADTVQYIDTETDEPVALLTYEEAMERWQQMAPFSAFVDATETVPTDPLNPDYDNFLANQDFKAGRVVNITWAGEQVTVQNPQADKGVIINTQGGRVTVLNLESEEGADDARGKVTYYLSGRSDNGQFKVYSNKKFQIVLDGLQLCCPDGPAISIQRKKRCFVTLADGSDNALADGAVYASDAETGAEAKASQGVGTVDAGGNDELGSEQEDEKGVLFSEGQLIFGGNGCLVVTGRHQHGIASDEYIRVHPGCRIAVCAVRDGIHAKEQYHQTGSLVCAYGQKDGLQSDSLGITLGGGALYLYGQRPYAAGGGGELWQSPAAGLYIAQ